ncbi:MAG: hypothetical protein Q4G02_02425 [bacterium]|nr:hypothetical protein [bacterium]
MQEHFIPQDISNYRFHLIGELDLQQFLEILGGVGVAVIIYQFNWPGIIKWPLMILFAGFGLVAAFIPIADQPLSHWIKVFTKALFAPTKFYWRKENAIPAYFLYELKDDYANVLKTQETFNTSPVKKHKAIDYFSTLKQEETQDVDKLETFNQDRLQSVLSDFAASPEPKVVIKPKKIIRKPSIQDEQSVRIRPIIMPSSKDVNDFLDANSYFKPTKVTTKITSVQAAKKHNLNWPQNKPLADSAPTTETVLNSVPAAPAKTETKTATSPAVLEPKKAMPAKPLPPIVPKASPSAEKKTTSTKPTPVAPAPKTENKISAPPTAIPEKTAAATPSELTENPEEKSMILRGKTVDKNGQPLAATILSLKDANNNLKFILRTDDKGEFNSDKALAPGKYILSAQKDLLIFPELLIDLDNQGIAPILLKAN